MSIDWKAAADQIFKVWKDERYKGLLSDEAVALALDMETAAHAEFLDLCDDLAKAGVKARQWQRALDAMRATSSTSSAAPGRGPARVMLDERPSIIVTPDVKLNADLAVRALASLPNVFQRAGRLVEVIRFNDQGAPGPVATDSPVIRSIERPRLYELLSECVYWQEKTHTGYRHARPPYDVTSAVIVRGTWPGVPHLVAVVEYPVLRPDGSLLATHGYDPATGLLCWPTCDVPAIPDQPTRDDALRAFEALRAPMAEFPFITQAHFVVWLAALLTLLLRFTIAGEDVPMLMLDANSAGTGKSKLADIISIILTGRRMTRRGYVTDEAEMKKTITSVVVGGLTSVLFDNVVGEFGGAALDAALTGGFWEDRLFGRNDTTISAKIMTFFIATGNNMVPKGDLERRVMLCRLQSDLERPYEREGFTIPRILKWVGQHRGELLAAAYTIIRAYRVAGSPEVPMKNWGGYEEWSDVVRAPLIWLGLADPFETTLAAGFTSPRRSAHALIVAGLQSVYGLGVKKTLNDVLTDIRESDEAVQRAERRYGASDLEIAQLKKARDEFSSLRDGLSQLAGCPLGRANAISLGMKLAQLNATVVNGLRLTVAPGKNGNTYAVEEVAGGGGTSVKSPQGSTAGTPEKSVVKSEASTTEGVLGVLTSTQRQGLETILPEQSQETNIAQAHDRRGSEVPLVPPEDLTAEDNM